MKLPQSIPFGRLLELKQHPDAILIAVKTLKNWDSEYAIKRYASRLALETFLKNQTVWNAIIKTPIDSNMLLHRSFQVAL